MENRPEQTQEKPADSRDKLAWVAKSDPVTVEAVEFRMASGRKVERDQKLHSQLVAIVARHYDGKQQQSLIKAHEAQKPEWFLAAESNARTFMASLGFKELGNIYLLNDHIDDVEGDHNIDAYHDSVTRDIIASETKMTHILETDGMNTATSVLVHELTHNTAPKPDRIVLHQHSDNSAHWAQRNGWLVSGEHGDQGSFLEEGFCEYVAGLYRLRNAGDNQDNDSLLPANYTPTADPPPHLQTSAVLAGPDAHAVELMAWGVENKGVMSANEFIGKLFAVRKEESSTEAMRDVIKAIDSLSPNLYSYLKNLERSPENWTAARDAVYRIVTA